MKSTFIHIDTAVMIGQLHLKGYELLVYALVSGLSKGGSEWVKKPLQWYADTLGAEKGRVSNALNKLVDKGLLEVKSDWKKKYYNISCQNSNLSVAKTATTSCQNSNLQVAKTAIDTLYNNNKNNTKNNSDDDARACEENIKTSTPTTPASQPSPTPLPPSPGDRALFAPIADIYREYRDILSQDSETSNAALRLARSFGGRPVSRETLVSLLDTFHDRQMASGDTHTTHSDYRRHFISWLRIQIQSNSNTPNNANNATRQNNRHDIQRSTEPSGADF